MKPLRLIISLAGMCAVCHAAPPNVVIILSDDQAWTDYGFMEHEVVETPNLDQLAESGVLFERGYVATPLCRPSLMTLATGRYPSDHKVAGNDSLKRSREGMLKMKERVKTLDTLAGVLGEKGYVSFQSGKWWEGHYTDGGFTDGMTQGYGNVPNGRHGDEGLKIGREGMEPVTGFIDKAVEEKKPFFVWYAPFMPHTPHNPPQRLLDKYKGRVDSLPVAQYYAMIEWFDETCGELIGHLKAKGVYENTLIIYICDNGWIQNPDQGQEFAVGSKQMPNEGGIRQPTIYSWPDRLCPARRDDLVSIIDIFPTICSATGAHLPEGLPGISLLEAMETKQPVGRERIFGESFAHDMVDVDDPEKTLQYRWVIEGPYKLILTYYGEYGRDDGYNKLFWEQYHSHMDPRPQLYDLLADPHETNNLAGELPEKVKHLVSALDKWYPVTKRTCIKTFEKEGKTQ